MVGSRRLALAKGNTMDIKAEEIDQYRKLHGVERVPLEAKTVKVPKIGYRNAKNLTSKRIVAFGEIYTGVPYNKNEKSITHFNYFDAEFKRHELSVPADFEFSIVEGEDGQKMVSDVVEFEGGLEKKFRKLFDKHNPAIQAKLAQANKLIEEAESIADKHGIPFCPEEGITGFSMSYIPENFSTLFGAMDRELVYDITNASYSGDYPGWQTSQTC